MPTRIDKPLFQAVANSIDISAYVTDCTISFDLSRRVSEATLRLYEWPAGISHWDTLDIYAGLTDVDEFTNGMLHRFTGYVWDPGFDLWPMGVTMLGRGPLILAERQKVPSDEELDAVANPPLTVDYAAPGIDLSVNPDTGAAWRDSDIITWVLGKCGLSGKIDNIGGLPHILGSMAFDQFCWGRQESGLSAIEKIDTIGMGFRTYDAMPCRVTDAAKPIRRTKISMLPDVVTTQATFWEGRDLLAGTSLKRSPSLVRNCVRVEGWNMGDYPQIWVKTGVHPCPPPGIEPFLDTEYFSSSLIELDTPILDSDGNIDYTLGISCQEVADWLLEEKRHDWWEVTAETWRDDPITAGDSVYLNAPRLAGSSTGVCDQAFWVQGIDLKIGPGKFRQSLRLRAPAYWIGPGSMLGNFQLGGALN